MDIEYHIRLKQAARALNLPGLLSGLDYVPDSADIQPVKRGRKRDRSKPAIEPAQRLFLLGMYGGSCVACGSTDRLCVDHIIPWSWTREHGMHNWQILCWRCDTKKSASVAVDYRLNTLVEFTGLS